MSTLILNADGAPVSWLPLSIIPWEEAVKYMVLEKAAVLDFYENWTVSSPNWSTRVPAVMMLNGYEKRKTTVRFSKSNVFLRDKYHCQYCNTSVTRATATLDHVLPISHGGKTTFENTVTACGACNSLKGNNKKIKPKIKPFKPSYFQLVENRRTLEWNVSHLSWLNYLG
ncbi:HNH endonuclease [bacterium]|nr:HNH endonuclease [bacterium]